MFIGEVLIHLILIFEVKDMRDFVFQAIMAFLTPKGLNVRTADKPVLVSVT
jgi:hypothetical protein